MATEYILDSDILYRRITDLQIDENDSISPVDPSAFYLKSGEKDLSVAWAEVITIYEASFPHYDTKKKKQQNIGKLLAIIPRSISLEVIPTPSFMSQSHSSINGIDTKVEEKQQEIARILAKKCTLIKKIDIK